MTPLAIALMLLAMLIIWGGLAVAITFLARHPLEDEEPPGAAGRRPHRTE